MRKFGKATARERRHEKVEEKRDFAIIIPALAFERVGKENAMQDKEYKSILKHI